MVQEIEEEVSTPAKKQPKQLMGDNETSSKKSPVKFDESRNIVKEFAKNEKIITNFKTPKKDDDLKPKKMAKIEETPKVEAAPKPDSKVEKMEKQMQEISKLQKSEVVIQARDDMMLKDAPTNFYQYERDSKSFKNDKIKKLKYIENIKADNVKSIFKSDLEADVMLDIFPEKCIHFNVIHDNLIIKTMRHITERNNLCGLTVEQKVLYYNLNYHLLFF